LAAGAAIETMDDYGKTPLHWAASGGHTDILLELLAKGAAIEARGYGGLTAREIAKDRGHDEIVAMIDAHARAQKLLAAASTTKDAKDGQAEEASPSF
jgi:ankyrin repeat protein